MLYNPVDRLVCDNASPRERGLNWESLLSLLAALLTLLFRNKTKYLLLG